MGMCYEVDKGVTEDKTEALAWFYAARACGEKKSSQMIDTLEKKLAGLQMTMAKDRADEILKEIVAQTGQTPQTMPAKLAGVKPGRSAAGIFRRR